MILYRARTIASRPVRHPEYQGNEPSVRVRGRWFTGVLASAIAHRATLEGESEIVAIDVPDAIVDSFRVAAHPTTACGIDVGSHSAEPGTDYVVQMFRVMDADVVMATATGRVRDYIDIHAPVRLPVRETAVREMPLAA
jgi:hypothetical protein